MTKKDSEKPLLAGSLRERAEAALGKRGTDLSRMSAEQTQRLVYELEVHQIELRMQNEELLRVQVDLAHSRDRFADLYDFAPVGYLTLALDSAVLEANLTLTTQLGIERSRLLGYKFTQFIMPETQDAFYLHQQAVFSSDMMQRCELSLRRADGTVFFARLTSLCKKDPITGASTCRSAVSDITEQKRAEAQIQAALREKEVLLRELHHRVKNNLQVISSLVSLQANGLSDAAMRRLLDNLRNRVRAMALVHEQFSQSESLAELNFADYVRSLLEYLFRAHGATAKVRLTLAIERITLPVDTAMHCGIILNELCSNALKHAFRDRDDGEVTVGLVRDAATNSVCLFVRDNGVGLPPGFDFRKAPSLGLRLVQMLASQLHGEAEAHAGPGTEFRVNFPLDPHKLEV